MNEPQKEPTIEELNAKLAEAAAKIAELEQAATTTATKHAETIAELETKHKSAIDKLTADHAAAIAEKAKSEYARGEKDMAFKLGSALSRKDPSVPKTKKELEENYDKVRHDVFLRARFLKDLKPSEKALLGI